MLELDNVCKHFTLHNQNSAQLEVLNNVNLQLHAGECVVLDGPSGMGKSTLIKLVYANYRPSGGTIRLRQRDGSQLELGQASPRELVRMRRESVSYVSQFLRVIPRVAALDVVAEPLVEDAPDPHAALPQARAEAQRWLARLRIPERLWHLPPATFSGGEQQRINIARSLIKPRPLVLLDEPTASLDPANTRTVIELIQEALNRGAALLGIFHDQAVAQAVATRRLNMAQFRKSV